MNFFKHKLHRNRLQQEHRMETVATRHPHYHKDVKHLETIDVYRVLNLFNVTDPCLQHAIKKLLVAGGRGAGKNISRDVKEAIDSLQRWQEMRVEDVSSVTTALKETISQLGPA